MDNTDNEGNLGHEETEEDRQRMEDIVSGNPEKQASLEDQTSSSLSKVRTQVEPVAKPIGSHSVTPPDDIQGQGPQTRSQGTQSLMGLEALEGMNKMRLERKKMEKLVKDMDNKKEELQNMESQIFTRVQDMITQQVTATVAKHKVPSPQRPGSQNKSSQKVPEIKSETAGSGAQQKLPNQPNNREEQGESEAEESTSSADKSRVTAKSRVRSQIAAVSFPKEKAFPENMSISTMSYSDPWSETGSEYVDKAAWEKRQDKPLWEYTPPVGTVGGFPLVQFPLPERLPNMSETAIESFLHEFGAIAPCVPTLTIQSLLTKKVSDALRLRGVNIKDGKAIVRYLQHHLSKCEARKRFSCLSEMENKLVWPVSSLTQEDQVYQFFDDIHAFLQYLDESEMKTHRKRIITIVFKKLPREIKYSMDQFLLTSKSQSLSSLKRIIFTRRHNLPTKETGEHNANKNYKQLHKPRSNLRRMEHNTADPRTSQDSYIQGTTKSYTPKVVDQPPQQERKSEATKTVADVNRLGDDATSIKLQMFDVNQKKFSPVKGITDTGSDLNVANLQKLEPFILSSEEPRKIKNIRFPNNALVKVIKVCRPRVQLLQGAFKLNLGEILFFVVDSPIWNDVIIGRNTLNAHEEKGKGEVNKLTLGPVRENTQVVKPPHKIQIFMDCWDLIHNKEAFSLRMKTYTFIMVIAPPFLWPRVFALCYGNGFRLGDSVLFSQRLTPTFSDRSLAFHTGGFRALIFFNNKYKGSKFSLQRNCDVAEENVDIEQTLVNIRETLLGREHAQIEFSPTPLSPGGTRIWEAKIAAKVANLKVLPFEEVEDEHFAKLEKNDAPHKVLPILISNMVNNIPEEFNEIGIGEGNIGGDEEKELLTRTIAKKTQESKLSEKGKKELQLLLAEHTASLGLKQSNAQMSLMTPIEVKLKPGSRNPIWGHPVFVVPKKMAKPEGWATMSSQQRGKWKADNILNRHRMVSNMVRLNKITVPTCLTLPNLERQLISVHGSHVYATLDILSGFDFLETEERSKDIFTLVTRRSAW
eukprot:augustus_masked-scaffold_36-processed-gene-2.23-mRNA-1 protein AED:1.00 eAED:1.00 QI:0/0/0/0/1/1/3/0/1035